MKKDQSRLVWGGVLILAGILFFLQELNILGNAFQVLWLLIMAAGAGVFLWIYFSRADQWWAIIPGLTLLGLAISALDGLLNILPGSNWTGAIFLGCIGLAFGLVYLRRQDQWWAVIPGGVMLTLAAVTGLDNYIDWSEVIFFLGLAATFLLVAVLPNTGQDTRWAYIPAAILGVIGLAIFAPIKNLMSYLFPALLIALGVYILTRKWNK
jgi:hypothetical protein